MTGDAGVDGREMGANIEMLEERAGTRGFSNRRLLVGLLSIAAIVLMGFGWGTTWGEYGSTVGAREMEVEALKARSEGEQAISIEWLEFRVDASERNAFIQRDDRIWTAALRQQPGFLHKSVLLSPDDPEFVGLAIYWASREAWDAFPAELIEDLDRQMQPTSAVLVRGVEYNFWQVPPWLQDLP